MKCLALLALTLAACGDSDKPYRDPSLVETGWQIGPIIGTTNYSVGLPLAPTPHLGGFSIDFGPDAEPHYVTQPTGPLAGQVRMRFRVEADPGVQIYGKGCGPDSPGTVTPYFQKRDDNWRTDGGRWWASFATTTLNRAGDYEIVAPLDGAWTSVMTMTAEGNPMVFAGAKDRAARVGFTFGNCTGLGHGVRATGPVKFVVTHFSVD